MKNPRTSHESRSDGTNLSVLYALSSLGGYLFACPFSKRGIALNEGTTQRPQREELRDRQSWELETRDTTERQRDGTIGLVNSRRGTHLLSALCP